MGPQSVVGGVDGSTVGYGGFLVEMVPGGQVDEGFSALRLRGITRTNKQTYLYSFLN